MPEFNLEDYEKNKRYEDRRQEVARYDKPYWQIAEEMNVSESTVKSWQKRGIPDGRVRQWCNVNNLNLWDVAPHLYPSEPDPAIEKYVEHYNAL